MRPLLSRAFRAYNYAQNANDLRARHCAMPVQPRYSMSGMPMVRILGFPLHCLPVLHSALSLFHSLLIFFWTVLTFLHRSCANSGYLSALYCLFSRTPVDNTSLHHEVSLWNVSRASYSQYKSTVRQRDSQLAPRDCIQRCKYTIAHKKRLAPHRLSPLNADVRLVVRRANQF
ncbi:hypothetical protein B0H11DRAFT_1201329 [Mycena galericulata]|nr:hypothetical protein B0H11DRAFT_1201329 [Mycena galericulata]